VRIHLVKEPVEVLGVSGVYQHRHPEVALLLADCTADFHVADVGSNPESALTVGVSLFEQLLVYVVYLVFADVSVPGSQLIEDRFGKIEKVPDRCPDCGSVLEKRAVLGVVRAGMGRDPQ